MKLRKNWDRMSAPIESATFVEQIVEDAKVLRADEDRAMIERLTKFCQALFDVLPEKTRTKIAAEFCWEPAE